MLIDREKKLSVRERRQQLRRNKQPLHRQRSSGPSANWPRLIDEWIRLKLKTRGPRPVKISPAQKLNALASKPTAQSRTRTRCSNDYLCRSRRSLKRGGKRAV